MSKKWKNVPFSGEVFQPFSGSCIYSIVSLYHSRTVRKGVRAQTHNAGEQGLLNKRENTRHEHNKREIKLVGHPSGRPTLR